MNCKIIQAQRTVCKGYTWLILRHALEPIMVTVGSPVRLFSIRMKSQSFILIHLFIVLKGLLFLTTHLNAQWNGTTGHY